MHDQHSGESRRLRNVALHDVVFGQGLVLGDDDEASLMNGAEILIDDNISAFLDQGTGNEGEGKSAANKKDEEIGKR